METPSPAPDSSRAPENTAPQERPAAAADTHRDDLPLRPDRSARRARAARNQRAKHKLILGLLAFFLLFGGGIWYMSVLDEAAQQPFEQVRQTATVADLNTLWTGFSAETRSEPGLASIARTCLDSLPHTNQEIVAADTWLREAPRARPLNVVVVPDLSYRIAAPGQLDDDKKLLHHIWGKFQLQSIKTRTTHDRLIVYLTDDDQAKGLFKPYLDKLRFDLKDHNKHNRLYFDQNQVQQRFAQYVDTLYRQAQNILRQNNTSGADYRHYVASRLQDHLMPASTFVQPRNIIIFLTDGYLETRASSSSKITCYTPTQAECARIEAVRLTNPTLGMDAVVKLALPANRTEIPASYPIPHLDGATVLLVQVEERVSGRDLRITEHYWGQWIGQMGGHLEAKLRASQSPTDAQNWLTDYLTGSKP